MLDDEEVVERYVPPWENRGTDLSRILALSDGVFAFAMTLLVLTIALPALGTPPSTSFWMVLSTDETSIISFILAFIIIGSFWNSHHLVFSYLRRWDRTLVQLNIFLLMLVALQPLALTFLIAFLSSTPTSAVQAVAFFAAIGACAGLLLAGIWWYASSERRLVNPHMDATEIRYLQYQLMASPTIFAISIAVAFVNPHYGEYVWIAFVPATFLFRHVLRRAAPAGPDTVTEGGLGRPLRPGDRAPSFDTIAADGSRLALSQFEGRSLALYFFPECGTLGCTRESRSFRDAMTELQNRGISIVGASTDPRGVQVEFARVEGLPFPLIPDPDASLARRYGVLAKGQHRARRVTFLIGPDGRIVRIVSSLVPDNHVRATMEPWAPKSGTPLNAAT
ncbi:MAG: redoxin domain-containing protein [Thermoplasmata archaeon]|nr:redoxin domain-containing protein [Thermoplasmata archaeon]